MKSFVECFVAVLFILVSFLPQNVLAAGHDDGALATEHQPIGSLGTPAHKKATALTKEELECLMFNQITSKVRGSDYTQVIPWLFPPAVIVLLPLTCTGVSSPGELNLEFIRVK